MRERGIRTITDFENVDQEYLESLARETALTLPALQNASRISVSDHNIDRLKRAAELLSHYWEGDRGDDADDSDVDFTVG